MRYFAYCGGKSRDPIKDSVLFVFPIMLLEQKINIQVKAEDNPLRLNNVEKPSYLF